MVSINSFFKYFKSKILSLRIREDERNGNWFAIESKSFKFTMEGEGKKTKNFITERSRDIASWIRFGVERMNNLLMGVEECCKVSILARRSFVWRENERFFRMECKENNAGRFLLCSATDAEGKKHRLFFREGRGFLNGWALLAKKIRGLGLKPLQEKKPMSNTTTELTKEEGKENKHLSKNKVLSWGHPDVKAVDEGGSSVENAVWVDASVSGKALGILQFCLIGKWKTKPEPIPAAKKVEVWVREAWRLNGGVMLAILNEDLLFLEFNLPEEAKWVLESGRRSFKGGVLQLERWSPESGCIRRKGSVQEAWIRVVGLPLHLWTPEILKKIGDVCRGFKALDKVTALRTEVKWARMLINSVGKSRPSVVSILEGSRSFELKILWKIPPWLADVYPVCSSVEAKNPKEEEDGGAHAALRVGVSLPRSNDVGQKGQECVLKNGRRLGLVGAEKFNSKSEEVMKFKGGAHANCWGNKNVGSSLLVSELNQQAGSLDRDISFSRLNGLELLGPKSGSIRSPKAQKIGQKANSGLKKSLKDQQAGSLNGTTDGAASFYGLNGPELLGPKQSGSIKSTRAQMHGQKANRGLKKGLKEASLGPKGVKSCFKKK